MLNNNLVSLQTDVNINNIRRGNIITKKKTSDEEIIEYKAILKNKDIHIDFIDQEDDGLIIPD